MSHRKFAALCCAGLPLSFSSFIVCAEEASDPHELAPVVVTANPLGNRVDDMVAPVVVVNRTDISDRAAGTLGETLAGIPGISTTNFGPNASRPIMRGLDADRIKIMQNGSGLLDVSALSPDHATPIDPLVIDQIDVVRGPAALLYGGSAVGGVINAIDNRIPKDAITGVSGRAEARVGGSDRQTSSAAVIESGDGVLSMHVDAFQRHSNDLRIPGDARSAQLRAQSPQADEANGTLPNSSGVASGGAVGASLNFDRGYAGVSFSGYNANYGTVAEQDVRIRMKSNRVDFASELRDVGPFIDALTLRYAHTEYTHNELEDGVVGTTFNTRGDEMSVEAKHATLALPFGDLSGVVGLQFRNAIVNAQGDESLLPDITTLSRAAYVYEELPLDRLKLSASTRVERTGVDSSGGGPIDPNTGAPRFGNAGSRAFTPVSSAFGVLYKFTEAWSSTLNLSHNERAPSYNELFANGPHPATGQYVIGDANLGVEKSNGIDWQVKWRGDRSSASVGAYYNRFRNYIGTFNTGNTRGEDGTLNPATDGLPEAVTRVVPANFYGVEAQGKWHVYEGVGDIDLRLKGDTVRAANRDTGEALPWIAPYHVGVGADYRLGDVGAKLDVIYAGKQTRVPANELPTDAYTLVNAMLAWRFAHAPNAEAFLKLNNLLNADARLATSVLKDIAPLGGRSALLGIRVDF
ncbi:MAG TPA: TonB-dependent receptor [Rhodocyclaceae bacterium]|nr:TonB-dependent receptor [Rhodocyclaceae bacterium]